MSASGFLTPIPKTAFAPWPSFIKSCTKQETCPRINLKNYISDLTELLLESYHMFSDKITILSEMEGRLFVLIDTAIPCGLILNELISKRP